MPWPCAHLMKAQLLNSGPLSVLTAAGYRHLHSPTGGITLPRIRACFHSSRREAAQSWRRGDSGLCQQASSGSPRLRRDAHDGGRRPMRRSPVGAGTSEVLLRRSGRVHSPAQRQTRSLLLPRRPLMESLAPDRFFKRTRLRHAARVERQSAQEMQIDRRPCLRP